MTWTERVEVITIFLLYPRSLQTMFFPLFSLTHFLFFNFSHSLTLVFTSYFFLLISPSITLSVLALQSHQCSSHIVKILTWLCNFYIRLYAVSVCVFWVFTAPWAFRLTEPVWVMLFCSLLLHHLKMSWLELLNLSFSPFNGYPGRFVCVHVQTSAAQSLFSLSQVVRRREVCASQRSLLLPAPHRMFTSMKSCMTLLSWWLQRRTATSWSRFV